MLLLCGNLLYATRRFFAVLAAEIRPYSHGSLWPHFEPGGRKETQRKPELFLRYQEIFTGRCEHVDETRILQGNHAMLQIWKDEEAIARF